MHPAAREFVRQHVTGRRFGSVVEVGALDVNGGVRDLIDCDRYVGVDRQAGPGVDLVANAHLLDHPATVNLVVCCEVLEHDPEPRTLVERMFGWLAPDGMLVMTCATDPRAPHGCAGGEVGSEWYGNVDPDDLAGIGLPVVCEVDRVLGDLRVVLVRDV
jgi:hypothetical protein